MMPPHWLDDVFETPEKAVAALTESVRFKDAVEKAQAAYKEGQEFHKNNPSAVGSSPAQKARGAFLEALNEN